MRFLFTFCLGIAATLGWQAYGDQARELIAKTYPQLTWVAQRGAAQNAPPGRTVDQQLQEMSLGLASMRQRVEQLSAQLVAGQDQLTRDITARVQVVEREILEKMASAGQPRTATTEVTAARKPTPPQVR
jgi:hypothetical protein